MLFYALTLAVLLGSFPSRAEGGAIAEWVEALSAEINARGKEEPRLGKEIRLVLEPGPGIRQAQLDKVLFTRLSTAIEAKGRLRVHAASPVHVRLMVSASDATVWSVGIFEGGTLPGPMSFAVDVPLTREFRALLNVQRSSKGRARWKVEPLGTVPGGVLDIALANLSGGFSDEIGVLDVRGLTIYRVPEGQGRIARTAEKAALPSTKRWPRVVAGWLADSGESLLVATTAGHHLRWSRATGLKASHEGRVPVRQDGASKEPIFFRGGYGSPLVATPIYNISGGPIRLPSVPKRVRDLRSTAVGTFVVSESGLLIDVRPEEKRTLLGGRQIGDKIVTGDFDANGTLDVVVSAPVELGEPDTLSIFTSLADPEGSLLFDSRLQGGSIVAMDAGNLNDNGRLDLVVVEEGAGDKATIWHLEFSP